MSNPDLIKERSNLDFDVESVSIALYGSDRLRRKRYIENIVLSEPVMHHNDINCMDRDEAYSTMMKKNVYALEMMEKLNLVEGEDFHFFQHTVNPAEASPLSLHHVMFIPTIENLGTSEQRDKWIPLAKSCQILGTYVQTEMGHGTFLRGLETTATFDPTTQCFIINSPTVSSTKWWPGSLGRTMNFCCLMAQLYTNGQCHGPHLFIVQLRSLDNHMPLNGITLGDIGPKLGFPGNDNGYVRFDHVPVPRSQLLMKYCNVAPDGTYTRLGDIRLTYGSMVQVRSWIALDAARSLAMAATIVTRYSAVRRQTELEAGKGEPQVLDYQTQQYKVIPQIAIAYAMFLSGMYLREMYSRVKLEIADGVLTGLPELHALSAGLKAVSSFFAADGAQRCLLACGGHGYAHSSGLPRLYANSLPSCIYEGDNTVMLLQTARYLVRSFAKTHLEGVTYSGFYSYLNPANHAADVEADVTNMSTIERFEYYFRRRTYSVLERAVGRMQELTPSLGQVQAWNQTGVLLVRASQLLFSSNLPTLRNPSQAHVEYFMVHTVAQRLTSVRARSNGGGGGDTSLPERLRAVFTSLYEVFAAQRIVESYVDFASFISPSEFDQIHELLFAALAELRPIAVPLVDAFDFHDHQLKSVLGRCDGRVYENMIPWTEQSVLNKRPIHDSYYDHLRPLLMRGREKYPAKI